MFDEAVKESGPVIRTGRAEDVLSPFQCTYFGFREVVFVQCVLTDVQLREFFPNHVSISFYLVIQLKCQHFKRFRGVDDFRSFH